MKKHRADSHGLEGKAGPEKCQDCSFCTFDKNKLADHRVKFHQVGLYLI